MKITIEIPIEIEYSDESFRIQRIENIPIEKCPIGILNKIYPELLIKFGQNYK